MRGNPPKSAEESEQRYTSLFQQNPGGVYSLDRRGNVVAVNPAMTSLLGFGASKLVGKNAARLIIPEDRRRAANRFAEVVGGEPQNYQLTVRRKDGSILELDVTQVPITSGSEVVGVHGTAKDITETRKAEEELKRSEERYRLVTLATKEAIWDNDLLSSEQRWAEATEALFGYPPHEGRAGTWWEERIHPDDRGKVLSGLAALLAEGGETWAEEYRFRRADGSYADVTDRGYAVHDEATGRVVRMVASMTDITDRRETETRLREAEARYRNVAESLGEGLLITDLEDTVLYANPRMAELSGYAVEEMLGKAGYELLLPQEQWAEVRRRNEKRARGMAERYETQLRRKDGTRFWATVSAAPYRDPFGEIVGTVGAFSDVTERKAAEDDLRRSERNLAEAQRPRRPLGARSRRG
jgi:PAS domain S-box-containing protein